MARLWVRICFVRFLLRRGIRTSGRGCTMHVARCTLHAARWQNKGHARSERDKGLCEPSRGSALTHLPTVSLVCAVHVWVCMCAVHVHVCVCLILSLSAAYPNANRFANVKAPATHDRRTRSSIKLSLQRGLGCHTMPVGSCKWLLLCTALAALATRIVCPNC